LNTNLFLEANPIPVKWALERMGKIQKGIRLPLVDLDEQFHQQYLMRFAHAGVTV
jgi:4-hydroxy-tetrahydrodipicolinate synthase